MHDLLLTQALRARRLWGAIAILTACLTVVLVTTSIYAAAHGDFPVAVFTAMLAILACSFGHTAESYYVAAIRQMNNLGWTVIQKQQLNKF